MTAAVNYDVPVVSQYQGRDFGQILLGFFLGIVVIMLLLYYRGGSGSLIPITSMFDRYRSSPATNPPPTTSRGRIEEGSVIPGARALRVKVDNLNLRTCPGFDCQPVATLPRGIAVTDLGQREFSSGQEWFKIRVGNYEGWVIRYYLE
ncbi:MAG: SH3 domain-containing protein [Acidobacteria bacterium]|nr:SH3 domain-containing protein [Acidobacteriota bacterium]